MNEYYYSVDGASVEGPYTSVDIQNMVAEQVIPNNCYLYKLGDSAWKSIQDFPELLKAPEAEESIELESTPVAKKAPEITEDDKESTLDEEKEIKERRPTRHQLLKKIRINLDTLWEAQRESIIARIKDDDLDTEYEVTRKRHKDIFEEIEESAIEYWRRSGIFKEWISDLTWNECDLTLRLKKGASEEEKFAQVMSWLDNKEIAGLPGVYCFRNGKDYIYVGQGRVLATRIKQHEQKTFFTYATHFRVIVAQNKKHLKRLERLVILNRQPSENIAPGSVRGNPADECLDFIKGEIRELITDF